MEMPWLTSLVSALQLQTGRKWTITSLAIGGATQTTRAAAIDADLAAYTGHAPDSVLVNLGVNGMCGQTESDWKTGMAYLIDAYHAKWPKATVYITDPWSIWGGAACNNLATWNGDLVATRSWAYSGDDERVWLEGGDNGATMTYDGVHYSTAGNAEKVTQMMTVLGY